jgi:hypothetical protein
MPARLSTEKSQLSVSYLLDPAQIAQLKQQIAHCHTPL